MNISYMCSYGRDLNLTIFHDSANDVLYFVFLAIYRAIVIIVISFIYGTRNNGHMVNGIFIDILRSIMKHHGDDSLYVQCAAIYPRIMALQVTGAKI